MTAVRVAWLALALMAAAPATARAARGWIEEPRVLSVHLVERGQHGDVIAVFAAPLEGAAPAQVTVQVSRAGSQVPVAATRVTWRGGWLTAHWPAALVRPGEAHDALLCPAGAACAPPVRFTAPARAPSPAAASPPLAPILLGLCALLGLALVRRRRTLLV